MNFRLAVRFVILVAGLPLLPIVLLAATSVWAVANDTGMFRHVIVPWLRHIAHPTAP